MNTHYITSYHKLYEHDLDFKEVEEDYERLYTHVVEVEDVDNNAACTWRDEIAASI